MLIAVGRFLLYQKSKTVYWRNVSFRSNLRSAIDIGFFSRYSIAEGTFPFYLQYQNVFFTLFLGLLTLVIIEKVALKISGDGRKSKVTKYCASLVLL